VAPERAVTTSDVVFEVNNPDATRLVNWPAAGVVAPTVPFILILAVPVKLVTVPLVGVPSAPPLTTNAPEEPTETPRAVNTPVPVVVVLMPDPEPPPINKVLLVKVPA
jgi:hypothetical protein